MSINRRIFLNVTLCLVFAAGKAFMQSKPSVGVTGGGLAGLTAAYRLAQHGFVVTVYEGSERLGGRVHTLHQENVYEELGGKNIQYGGPATNIRYLINECGLQTEVDEVVVAPWIYDTKGERVAYAFLQGAMQEPTPELYEKLAAILTQAASLAEGVTFLSNGNADIYNRIDRYLLGFEGGRATNLDAGCIGLLWFIYEYLYESVYGKEDSLPSFEQVAGGNDALIQALVSHPQIKVRVNSLVTEVKLEGEKLALKMPDQSYVMHDKVICALPCAAVGKITFPVGFVPADQWEAMANVSYSSVAKILFQVTFTTPPPYYLALLQDGVVWFNHTRTVAGVFVSGAEHPIFAAADKESQDKIFASYAAQIKEIYPTIASIEPLAIAAWPQAYSYFGVGQHKVRSEIIPYGKEQVRKVFRPIEDKFFFAGEHTALGYHATLEGAVESGERAARLVMEK